MRRRVLIAQGGQGLRATVEASLYTYTCRGTHPRLKTRNALHILFVRIQCRDMKQVDNMMEILQQRHYW